jgi:hypothetical protein
MLGQSGRLLHLLDRGLDLLDGSLDLLLVLNSRLLDGRLDLLMMLESSLELLLLVGKAAHA